MTAEVNNNSSLPLGVLSFNANITGKENNGKEKPNSATKKKTSIIWSDWKSKFTVMFQTS